MIDPRLLNAVIQQESRGNARAVSPAGAAGLMQVMPATARSPGFGVQPLDWGKRFDPQENVRFGTQYLGAMVDRYKGDLPRALVAYNAGAGTADKWDGRTESLPAETRGYLQNIIGSLNQTMAAGGGQDVLAGGEGKDSLRKITDPALLERLEGKPSAGGGLRKVTDPEMLKRLEGVAPQNIETPDGPQPGQVLPKGARQIDVLDAIPGIGPVADAFGVREDANNAAVRAADSFMGNWGDDAIGAIAGPRAAMRMRTEQDDFKRRHPVVAGAADVAGVLGNAAALGGGLVGRATGAIGKTAMGALEGAGLGAFYAAGNADKGQKVEEGLKGAAGGAVVGAAATRAGIGLERYFGARAARKAAPTAEALKESSRALFDAAEQSGVIYKPQAVLQAVDDLVLKMGDELIDPTLHPNASAVVKRLPELLSKTPTLKEVERFRQLAGGAARSAQPGSADQRLSSMIVEALDDFTLDQSNMVATSGGAEMQAEARRLWSQYMKDQNISFQVEKAMRNAAASGSGGNANNAIRQGIKSVLNNKKARQGFTPEEIAAMEKIVQGGNFDGLMRLVGKLSPSGNGLMLALQTGAGAATGGASLPLAVMGAGAKGLADTATTRRVAALGAMIRAGGKPPHGMISQLSGAERQALARLVSAKAGETVGEPIVEGARGLAAPETVP